jgi:SMI1 / KNR4 family (SUKH-1)
MSPETIALVERVTRRLAEANTSSAIAGPASDAAIDAAEEALGCEFPPSYRQFLRRFGALTIPTNLGLVHHFVGIEKGDGQKGVVERTLGARVEKRLSAHLVVVGMGADFQEWFCLDLDERDEHGEHPIVLFDARDNALDQKFYESFGQMLDEVLTFVEQNLDEPAHE